MEEFDKRMESIDEMFSKIDNTLGEIEALKQEGQATDENIEVRLRESEDVGKMIEYQKSYMHFALMGNKSREAYNHMAYKIYKRLQDIRERKGWNRLERRDYLQKIRERIDTGSLVGSETKEAINTVLTDLYERD